MADARQSRQRLIVIAGEMLELGPDEVSLHREAGREIAETGVDLVWGVRGLGKEIATGAAEAGVATRFFDSSEDAATEVVKEVREGDLILIKGSRGVATDKVVSALRERFPLAGEDVKG
jgi:UDP-N-acetylmuramoyl-tripeptide--D-alanyl-D-alanine ligase